MSVVKELLRGEADGTISFGDYTLDAKKKLEGVKIGIDEYKVKTYNEITKLERNGLFVYESVPGTAVNNFSASADTVSFMVEGVNDAEITLEMEPECEYQVVVAQESTGVVKSNLGGKVSFAVELSGDLVDVEVKRI